MPDEVRRQAGEGAPLPYGALDGQTDGSELLGELARDPLAAPSPTGGPWHPGPAAVFRPKTSLLALMAIVIAAVVLAIFLVRSGPAVIPVLYGVLLVLAVLTLLESLYARVRVDAHGITRRSLRGTATYRREEMALPVLHQYIRRSRSGQHKAARLSIRRKSGRYGFMITSDLYRYAEVEQIARRIGAARPGIARGIDIEAQYPGATLWVHRHPVLLSLLVGASMWIAAMVLVFWLVL